MPEFSCWHEQCLESAERRRRGSAISPDAVVLSDKSAEEVLEGRNARQLDRSAAGQFFCSVSETRGGRGLPGPAGPRAAGGLNLNDRDTPFAGNLRPEPRGPYRVPDSSGAFWWEGRSGGRSSVWLSQKTRVKNPENKQYSAEPSAVEIQTPVS